MKRQFLRDPYLNPIRGDVISDEWGVNLRVTKVFNGIVTYKRRDVMLHLKMSISEWIAMWREMKNSKIVKRGKSE